LEESEVFLIFATKSLYKSYNMNRILQPIATTFVLFFLCFSFLSAQAQDFEFAPNPPKASTDTVKKNKNVINSMQGMVMKFSPTGKHIDTAYIYRPKPQWMIRLNGNIQQTGVKFYNDMHADFYEGNAPSTETLDARIKINMEEKVHYQMGVAAGWGGLSLGVNWEIGRKSAEKNTSMYLAFKRTFYGLQLYYHNIKQKPNGTAWLSLDSEETGHIETGGFEAESDYTAKLKEIVVDGYYAFNRKRFAYTAVYSGSVVQRRSAGSWMLGAKYMWTKMNFDDKDDFSQTGYQQITGFTVQQGSIGGGYSYNLVALHHNPTGVHEKGLRNLTFNVTAMPMLTLLNSITTHRRVFDHDDDGDVLNTYTDKKEHSWGKIHLNYVAYVGGIFSFNRYSLRLEGHYNFFKFRHKNHHDNIETADKSRLEVNTKSHGNIYDWGVVMRFTVRL